MPRQYIVVALLRLLYLQTSCCLSNDILAGESAGQQIWKYLFEEQRYNRYVRPVKDWSRMMVVNISLSIIGIVEFDEVGETISITGKMGIAWVDDFLAWSPQEFGGVEHIHVPQMLIWRPYIAVENSISKQTDLGSDYLQVLLRSDGSVEWTPVEVFQFTCSVNVAKFPFDTQECVLTFEAFGYTHDEMMIQSQDDTIHFHGFAGTSGWNVVDSHVVTVQEDDDIHVAASIKMIRKPLYFVLNIIFPISLLSFLNCCVFILPVQSGEKASFVVTVFLSLAVFLTIVSSKLPENSERVSVFNVYVVVNTALSTVIAVVTLIEIRLHHRNRNAPIQPFLQNLTRRLTPGLGRSRVGHKKGLETSGVSQFMEMNGHSDGERRITVTENTPEKSASRDSDKMCQDVPNVTWPDVVKAVDKIFFVIVFSTNVCLTIHFLLSVMN